MKRKSFKPDSTISTTYADCRKVNPGWVLVLILIFSCSSPQPPSLILAAAAGDIPKIRAAVSAGQSVDTLGPIEITNVFGEKVSSEGSPLQAAAAGGKLEAVELLLELGATVNLKNRKGNTALLIASRFGHDDVVRLLLRHGADPQLSNTQGFSPLHEAIALGRLTTVSILLQSGSDPNAVATLNITPLSLAASGKTPHAILESAGNGKSTVVSGLKDEGASYYEIVKLLVSRGAKLDMLGSGGHTPLSMAAQTADISIVKLLLQLGANVNQQNADTSRPLDMAVGAQRREIAELLVQKGGKCTFSQSRSKLKQWKIVR